MNINAYFALFVPWIILALFVLLIVFVLKKWYKSGIALAVTLLLINYHWRVFPVQFGSIEESKSKDVLRVMTWNICCADSASTENVDGLLSAILEQDADVVFLTEYSISYAQIIDSIMCVHYSFKGGFDNTISGGELYSRYPIDTCIHIGANEKECVYKYVVDNNGVQSYIYCVHLQSNNLVGDDSFYPDSIADRGGIMRYLDNYKAASEIRREQAKLIVSDLPSEPSIVMGDFNDVVGSPCMKVFAEAGLRDAWWEGGFGYGATIHKPLAYRIDHVLYSGGSNRFAGSKGFQKVSGSLKSLKLKGIRKVSANGLSDHDALVADFEIE